MPERQFRNPLRRLAGAQERQGQTSPARPGRRHAKRHGGDLANLLPCHEPATQLKPCEACTLPRRCAEPAPRPFQAHTTPAPRPRQIGVKAEVLDIDTGPRRGSLFLAISIPRFLERVLRYLSARAVLFSVTKCKSYRFARAI